MEHQHQQRRENEPMARVGAYHQETSRRRSRSQRFMIVDEVRKMRTWKLEDSLASYSRNDVKVQNRPSNRRHIRFSAFFHPALMQSIHWIPRLGSKSNDIASLREQITGNPRAYCPQPFRRGIEENLLGSALLRLALLPGRRKVWGKWCLR